MPGCVLPIKELHTPGLGPPAQPAVLRCTFAWNGGVGDAKLPVGFPSHIDLPVMAAKAEALQTDDIQRGVEALGNIRERLPGVGVGHTVPPGGDQQFWVSRLRIQMYLTGIWR